MEPMSEFEELAQKYARPGIRIAFLSQSTVNRLGMRGYRQLIDENGAPVTTQGGMLVCGLPSEMAANRQAMSESITKGIETSVYGKCGLAGAINRAADQPVQVRRFAFLSRWNDSLKNRVAGWLIRFGWIKLCEREQELARSFGRHCDEAGYLHRKAVRSLWFGSAATMRRQQKEFNRRAADGQSQSAQGSQ